MNLNVDPNGDRDRRPEHVPDEVLLARAYLSRAAEAASVPVWLLVRDYGVVEAANMIKQGQVRDGIGALAASRSRLADPEADLEAALRHGIRLVTPEGPEWPHFAFAALTRAASVASTPATGRPGRRCAANEGTSLKDAVAPPLALWVKGPGDLATAGFRAAAIVGARASTPYGEHVAADLSYGLAGHDVTVVSGGAFGIDAVAHRAALAAHGSTTVVSAGGIDRPYPLANAAIYEQAADTGLVLSESPPGSAPARRRFLTRNRLIAALSSGVVVVEAAARSGAISTARHADRLGRPLMVVPGPVTSPMSVGCHGLLRDETLSALLVESCTDVLAVVGGVGEGIAMQSGDTDTGSDSGAGSRPAGLRERLDQLEPVVRQVFDGMPSRGAVSEERLAALAGVGVRDAIRAIPALRLAGLIETTDDGHRISRDARRANR